MHQTLGVLSQQCMRRYSDLFKIHASYSGCSCHKQCDKVQCCCHNPCIKYWVFFHNNVSYTTELLSHHTGLNQEFNEMCSLPAMILYLLLTICISCMFVFSELRTQNTPYFTLLILIFKKLAR